MIDHLDRIEQLGFTLNLSWNKSFEIIYDIESPLDLRVSY